MLVEAFRTLADDRSDLLLDRRRRRAPIVERSRACRRRPRARVAMLGRLDHADVPPFRAGCRRGRRRRHGQESFGVLRRGGDGGGGAGRRHRHRRLPAGRRRDGLDAVLVPPGDAGALAAAGGLVLDRRRPGHRLEAAGRETAAPSTGRSWYERIEDVYRSVLADHRYIGAMSPAIWIVLGVVAVAAARRWRLALQPARLACAREPTTAGPDRRAAAPPLRPHPEPRRDRAGVCRPRAGAVRARRPRLATRAIAAERRRRIRRRRRTRSPPVCGS